MAFSDKMKEFFDKSLSVSKVALNAAGSALQSFGDQSVIRIEKAQFESKLKKIEIELGEFIYKTFSEDGKESIDLSNQELANKLQAMQELKKEIAHRDEILAQTKAKPEESEKSAESENAAPESSEKAETASEAAEEKSE